MTETEKILHNFGKKYAEASNDWLIVKAEQRKKQLVKRVIKRLFLREK